MYRKLQRWTVESESTRSPSTLKDTLEQLEITPLPPDFIATYKHKKLEEMMRRPRPSSAREITEENFSRWEREEIRRLSKCKQGDDRPVFPFWHRLWKKSLFELHGDPPVIRFWETSPCLRSYTCLRWVRVPLEEVRDVPEFVQAKAREIANLLPGATFTVEQLRSEHRIYDPFLIVSYGDESYYLEVWDEAEFERKYT